MRTWFNLTIFKVDFQSTIRVNNFSLLKFLFIKISTNNQTFLCEKVFFSSPNLVSTSYPSMVSLCLKNDPENGPKKLIKWVLITIDALTLEYITFQNGQTHFNPLSANPTKQSNTFKQFVGKLPTNCLSVFHHFVRLALKGLKIFVIFKLLSYKHIWF